MDAHDSAPADFQTARRVTHWPHPAVLTPLAAVSDERATIISAAGINIAGIHAAAIVAAMIQVDDCNRLVAWRPVA